MLEFAESSRLAWLGVLALLLLGWLLARRYRRARVTYGALWEKAARKLRPPAWRRLLRTLATLGLGMGAIAAGVFFSAGTKLAEEQQGPLVLVLVLDTSPSMQARMGPDHRETRFDAAWKRAGELVEALEDGDRAVLVWFDEGQPVAGRWLHKGELPADRPRTDFAPQDVSALAPLLNSLGLPPDMPTDPEPHRLLWWLGDAKPNFADRTDPPLPTGIPVVIETFGEPAVNLGLGEVRWTPAGEDDAQAGSLAARLFDGSPARVEAMSRADVVASGEAEIAVPRVEDDLVLRARSGLDDPADALPQDDIASARLAGQPARDIVVCFRPEAEPNPVLLDALKLVLPGHEIRSRSVAPNDSVSADVIVLDGARPGTIEARLLLCFGVLPPELGGVEPAVEATPGLYLVHRPGVDFEVPDPSLLGGRGCIPLNEDSPLTPLATHLEAGVLAAEGALAKTPVLYLGWSPTESNFLFVPSGLLLLKRWVDARLTRERVQWPLFLASGETTEIRLGRRLTLAIELVEGWPTSGPERQSVTTDADGRAILGPFLRPGLYRARDAQGLDIGEFSVVWRDPPEQRLPFDSLPAQDLSLLRPEAPPWWHGLLPDLLLWLALGLLLAEWLSWLLGWTD